MSVLGNVTSGNSHDWVPRSVYYTKPVDLALDKQGSPLSIAIQYFGVGECPSLRKGTGGFLDIS